MKISLFGPLPQPLPETEREACESITDVKLKLAPPSRSGKGAGGLGPMAIDILFLFNGSQIAVEPGQSFLDEFVPGGEMIRFKHLQFLVFIRSS